MLGLLYNETAQMKSMKHAPLMHLAHQNRKSQAVIRYLWQLNGHLLKLALSQSKSRQKQIESFIKYNVSPLSAVHERPCQWLIHYYRHHLTPDKLSLPIPRLRVGGTLKGQSDSHPIRGPWNTKVVWGCACDI